MNIHTMVVQSEQRLAVLRQHHLSTVAAVLAIVGEQSEQVSDQPADIHSSDTDSPQPVPKRKKTKTAGGRVLKRQRDRARRADNEALSKLLDVVKETTRIIQEQSVSPIEKAVKLFCASSRFADLSTKDQMLASKVLANEARAHSFLATPEQHQRLMISLWLEEDGNHDLLSSERAEN